METVKNKKSDRTKKNVFFIDNALEDIYLRPSYRFSIELLLRRTLVLPVFC